MESTKTEAVFTTELCVQRNSVSVRRNTFSACAFSVQYSDSTSIKCLCQKVFLEKNLCLGTLAVSLEETEGSHASRLANQVTCDCAPLLDNCSWIFIFDNEFAGKKMVVYNWKLKFCVLKLVFLQNFFFFLQCYCLARQLKNVGVALQTELENDQCWNKRRY